MKVRLTEQDLELATAVSLTREAFEKAKRNAGEKLTALIVLNLADVEDLEIDDELRERRRR